MTMKKTLAFTLVTFLSVFALIYSIAYTHHNNTTRVNEWLSNCAVITVYIESGDTLDYYGYQYKPSWMDVRDYREYIEDLNNMDCADIYAGQTLKFYVEQGTYTSECGGICVIYGDNGTPNYVDDDVILGTRPVVD